MSFEYPTLSKEEIKARRGALEKRFSPGSGRRLAIGLMTELLSSAKESLFLLCKKAIVIRKHKK